MGKNVISGRNKLYKLTSKSVHAIVAIHITLHQSAPLQIKNYYNQTSKITVLKHNQ